MDLSDALRVPRDDGEASDGWARQAVDGLPELHRERIRTAELVANPGCYPTAALLAVAPLLRRGPDGEPLHVNADAAVPRVRIGALDLLTDVTAGTRLVAAVPEGVAP